MNRRAPRSRRFAAGAKWSLRFGAMTFSRSSEASYLTGAPTDGSSAFLSWAANDVLREENRGDGGGALALFEGSRTNVALRSQELDGGGWTTAGTVTKTAGLGGPDGNNAERLQAASGTHILYQSINFTAGRWALSAWARATSGTSAHFLIYYDGSSVYDGPSATLTTTYQRMANAQTVGTGAGNIEVIDGRNVGSFLAGARDARLDLVQLEAGRFASSAIRTAGATATRSADTLTMTTGIPPALLSRRGEFAMVSPVFGTADLTSGDVFWLLSIGGGSDGIRIRHTGTDVRVEAVAGGSVVASSAAQTWSAHALVGPVSWDPVAGLVYVNGTAGAAGTPWSWSSASVRVGGIHGGASEAFCRLGALGGW